MDRADLDRLGGLPDRAQLPLDDVADGVCGDYRTGPAGAATGAGATRLEGAAPDAFDLTTVRRIEGPLWRLVHERPAHLLDPAFPTWDALLLAAIDGTLELLTAGGPLAERTWGEANAADIAHPLATAAPWLGRFLTMPRDPLPGDTYVPRVLTPRSGASERFVVSPGHEATGILQMPGGQSGHPLSPHFRDQQRAWIEGVAMPLQPGDAVHTLTLAP